MTDTIHLLIEALDRADSAQELVDAVENLAATGEEAAIPSLVEVLSFNNPGAAVAAVDGLIKIGVAAVPYLLENIDGYNYGARAWATRALSGIGDIRAIDLLLEAASTDFSLSVRRAAAKGLGYLRWETADPEHLLALQTQVLKTLLQVSQDPEWVVRYGTIVGLEGLAGSLDPQLHTLTAQIQGRLTDMALTDAEMAVRARSQLALQSQYG